MNQDPLLPADPAATLILMREGDGGAPELLLIERAAGMSFAAGATVFPGGRVDPGDVRLGASLMADPEEGAARVAAIRETIEEAGVAAGFAMPPSRDALVRIREGLHAGTPFDALLVEEGLALDLQALVPFARWRPNFKEARIFDTRFYVARAPADAEPIADGGESVCAAWMTAADALAAVGAGARQVIFPTRRNLERLASLSSFAAACDHAAAHPVALITPWIEMRGEERWLCIPDGIGYPVTAEAMRTVRRG